METILNKPALTAKKKGAGALNSDFMAVDSITKADFIVKSEVAQRDFKGLHKSEKNMLLMNREEYKFLQEYFPPLFSNGFNGQMPQALDANLENLLRVILGKFIVKSENSIYNGSANETYLQDRLPVILQAAHILGHEIKPDKLYAYPVERGVRITKQHSLEMLMHMLPEDFEYKTIEPAAINPFPSETSEIYSLFGDVPILIHGSAAKTAKEIGGVVPTEMIKSDVDMQVFVPILNDRHYKTMQGQFDSKRKPRISFNFVPQNFTDAYYSSLPSMHENITGDSVLVSGTAMALPVFGQKHREGLLLADIAIMLYELRRAAIKESAEKITRTHHQMQYIAKLPKFIYRDLKTLNPNFDFPEEDVKYFELPKNISGRQFMQHVYEANLSASMMISHYVKNFMDGKK